MWQKITEHPFVATGIAAMLFFFAAWPVFSDDTVPEFLEKRGWVLNLPTWYYVVVLALGFAVITLQLRVIRAVLSRPIDQPKGKTYSGAEVTEVIEARHAMREYQTVVTERDSLATELERAKTERDEAQEGIKAGKREFAHERLRLYSGLTLDGDVKPTVTIRFATYAGGDHALVQKIKEILREFTNWEVTVDGTNDPALPPAEKFKVLFESGWAMTFDRVAFAFSDGDLLGVPVGKATADRRDHHRLVIRVLPSAS